MPGGGEKIRYAAPSPIGDALVRDGVDGGDADAKKDGGDAVKGGGFYGGKRIATTAGKNVLSENDIWEIALEVWEKL